MFEKTHYRIRQDIQATTINDDEQGRFPDDTRLPAGTEFVILTDKHGWPKAGSPLFYTIEVKVPGSHWKEGGRYNVAASQLEPVMEKA